MIIAKNDEEKRSRIWSRGMVVSSIIIVFVAVYLLIKVINENPVAGEWLDDEGNYAVNFLNNGKVQVTDYSGNEGTEKYELLYKLDKEERIIVISSDETALEQMMNEQESVYSEDELEAELNDETVTFTYSIDNEQLVLTEQEYGEQLILIRE